MWSEKLQRHSKRAKELNQSVEEILSISVRIANYLIILKSIFFFVRSLIESDQCATKIG